MSRDMARNQEHGSPASSNAGPGLPAPESSGATAEPTPEERVRLDEAVRLLSGRRLALLTGAGLSTDSGIPDYRGPGAPRRNPMTYQQFIGDPVLRQRYWARNHVGWHNMRHALPNAGHRAVTELERRGLLTGVITQNVDRLHTDAGSREVIDLHGRYDEVICLDCASRFSREHIAELLLKLNPGYLEQVGDRGEINPDADAEITETAHFVVADCPVCGGVLKPDFVYFGENVPKDRVAAAFDILARADALLVAGSSLTVMSGLRFVRRAHKDGQPVVIINRGPTRGDELADLLLDMGTAPALSYLAAHLPATGPAGPAGSGTGGSGSGAD